MKKRGTIPALMISTLLLLVAFEYLWLKSTFHDQLTQLRREVNVYYRSTLTELQDSLTLKNMKAVGPDSNGGVPRQFVQSLRVISKLRDSLKVRFDSTVTHESVRVFVNSPIRFESHRSDTTGIRQSFPDGRRSFVTNLKGDTLQKKDIETHYLRTLQEAGLALPFRIVDLSGLDNKSEGTVLTTDWVPFPAAGFAVATFGDVRFFLLRRMMPQILFSLVLTTLAVLSFVLMYRSLRTQQKLVDIKNDLISNLTHELKTPISTVSVALEALKGFKTPEDAPLAEEYIDMARQELARLALLTDKVLTSALLDHPDVQTEKVVLLLDEAVRGVLRSLRVVATKREATITFDTTGTDFRIRGSAIHLTHVIYNLVDNAIKYSPSAPVVHLHLADEGSQLLLSVKDEGMGIAAEYQGKIFEKFFRAPTGDVHNVKGHGLGLSYVDQVVRAHQGKIQLVSTPGAGAHFIITLPKSL